MAFRRSADKLTSRAWVPNQAGVTRLIPVCPRHSSQLRDRVMKSSTERASAEAVRRQRGGEFKNMPCCTSFIWHACVMFRAIRAEVVFKTEVVFKMFNRKVPPACCVGHACWICE